MVLFTGIHILEFLLIFSNFLNSIFHVHFTVDIVLPWVQVYSTAVRQWHTLQRVPPDTASTHRALCRVITILLTVFPVFPVLCCSLHPCNYCVTVIVYFSILSPFSPRPSNSLPSVNYHSAFSIYESVMNDFPEDHLGWALLPPSLKIEKNIGSDKLSNYRMTGGILSVPLVKCYIPMSMLRLLPSTN